jgi:opacity protein-like surface antigen
MMKTFMRYGIFGLLISCLTAVSFSQVRVGKLGIGLRGEAYLFQSDYVRNKTTPGGGLDISYSLFQNVGLRLAAGAGSLQYRDAANTKFTTSLFYGSLYVSVDFMPNSSFNPFVFVGGGLFYFDPRRDDNTPYIGANSGTKEAIGIGAGADYFLSEFISLTVSGEYVLGSSDRLDGYVFGSDKDAYQRVSLGLRYYFFDQDFITKLLKALEERYKR